MAAYERTPLSAGQTRVLSTRAPKTLLDTASQAIAIPVPENMAKIFKRFFMNDLHGQTTKQWLQ